MTDQNPFQMAPGENQPEVPAQPVPPMPPTPQMPEAQVPTTPVAPAMPAQPAVPPQPAAPMQPQFGAYSQTGAQTPSSQAPYAGQGVNATQVPPAPQAPATNYPQNGQFTQAGQFPQGSMAMPGAAPGQKLPGRGKSVAMLVIGLVMMFFIAPIAVFVGVLSGIGGLGNDTVTVGTNGQVHLQVTGPNAEAAICGITDGENVVELDRQSDGSFTTDGIPEGTYDIVCDNLTDQDVVIAITDSVVGNTLAGVGISMLIGFIGLVLTIVGIVMLVKTNKRRKAMMTPTGW
ncbi:hypothetical protein HMPREF0044_0162 [Gleimia coleocanis DSM 15436]|uniref:Uncharacterized protein n=1 Tax=Gleimia coleocanis DSM 15436 TaxID=525245 RepID=C0VYC2_9ACTO|nr:hypothetical protein [Gleimia coleocanis]EEH64425.1 hypothetical protein HMPREF0044_0162 [Gleimia coleocanis DSM 15436]